MSCCESGVNSTAEHSYQRLKPHVDALASDGRFEAAIEALNVDRLADSFERFTRNIVVYNEFHRRERRLWTLKIVNGAIPGNLEQQFVEAIPEGRARLMKALESMDDTAQLLAESGLGEIASDHLRPFMVAALENPTHPFARLTCGYLTTAGLAPEMIAEFSQEFQAVDFDVLNAMGGSLAQAREFARRGLEAQVQILDYTAEHGFSYLRGSCGPPKWAVTASAILSAVGISISAWVIVAIIVVLLATLVVICVAASRTSGVGRLCQRLNRLLPIFSF